MLSFSNSLVDVINFYNRFYFQNKNKNVFTDVSVTVAARWDHHRNIPNFHSPAVYTYSFGNKNKKNVIRTHIIGKPTLRNKQKILGPMPDWA